MEERPYITCRELIEFLYRYLSGELPPDRRAEFDRHLGACPSCVTYIRTYQDTIALGKTAFADTGVPVGEEVPDELVAAILKVQRRDPQR